MRASGLSIAGTSLLVVSAFAGVAAAMEPNGPGDGPMPTENMPAGSVPAGSMYIPAFEFPAFISADQAPLLQAAWQAHASDAEATDQAPALMRGDAMSAARAAMQRVGSATRKPPAVRQAAEELSLRFSGLGGATATAGASASVVVPTALDAIPDDAQAIRQDEAEAAAVAASDAGDNGSAAPVMATSAIPEAEMRPQSAQLDEIPSSLRTQTGRTVVTAPPLPQRAPAATARNEPDKPAPRSNASASTRMVTIERPPRVARDTADRGEVFPHYMRAFGWDDQP
jgi:hypothetical protein